MTAKITARDEDGIQLRPSHGGNVEWLYNIRVNGKKLSLARAELLRAPAGFGTDVGLVTVTGSSVASGVKKGKPWIRLHTVRPVKNSGVDATIQLAREEL